MLGYIVLVVLFFTILFVETKYGNFHEDETVENFDETVLLEKIDNNADFFLNVVYWRRSFILSFIACLIIFNLVLGKIADPRIFLLSTLAIMLPIYYSFNFYQYHQIKYKTRNMRRFTNILRDQENLKHYY